MASDSVNVKFMMNYGFKSYCSEISDDIRRVLPCVPHKSLLTLLRMRKECFIELCRISSHYSSSSVKNSLRYVLSLSVAPPLRSQISLGRFRALGYKIAARMGKP